MCCFQIVIIVLLLTSFPTCNNSGRSVPILTVCHRKTPHFQYGSLIVWKKQTICPTTNSINPFWYVMDMGVLLVVTNFLFPSSPLSLSSLSPLIKGYSTLRRGTITMTYCIHWFTTDPIWWPTIYDIHIFHFKKILHIQSNRSRLYWK